VAEWSFKAIRAENSLLVAIR